MGLCVALQADGTLLPTGQTVEECTGYVLASPAEIWLTTMVEQALAMPEPEVLVGWWLGSFGLVMVAYMAGWAVGSIVESVR